MLSLHPLTSHSNYFIRFFQNLRNVIDCDCCLEWIIGLCIKTLNGTLARSDRSSRDFLGGVVIFVEREEVLVERIVDPGLVSIDGVEVLSDERKWEGGEVARVDSNEVNVVDTRDSVVQLTFFKVVVDSMDSVVHSIVFNEVESPSVVGVGDEDGRREVVLLKWEFH